MAWSTTAAALVCCCGEGGVDGGAGAGAEALLVWWCGHERDRGRRGGAAAVWARWHDGMTAGDGAGVDAAAGAGEMAQR